MAARSSALFVLPVFLFLCLPPAAAPARGEPTAEDLLEGFSDDAEDQGRPPPPSVASDPSPAPGGRRWLSGYGKIGAAYNFAHQAPEEGETDWRGLSRLRAELQLEADFRLGEWKLFVSGKGWYDTAYLIRGRDGYPSEVLDAYENEAEVREAWLQGSLFPFLDVKVGRQIVVWGRSDTFRVTDILNPLDFREPGMTDIEDLRLPLAMTKVDVYAGRWNLAAVTIHEHRFDKTPAFGHDFYPGDIEGPPENEPSQTLENTEYAVELKGVFTGWDLSLHGARVYHDQLTFVNSAPVSAEHRRVTMAGAAASAAAGDFLLFAEAAQVWGLRFMLDDGTDYSRTDLLLGIEYSGLAETVIGLDAVYRRLHDYTAALADSPEYPRENDVQIALRISREFLNDTVKLTALVVSQGERAQNGSFERITAAWELADGWTITGGAALYQSGTGIMRNAGDNDRLFLETRFDF